MTVGAAAKAKADPPLMTEGGVRGDQVTNSSVPCPMSVPHNRVVVEPEAIPTVEKVLRSGHVTMGLETRRLEDALSAYLGGRHVVAVSSGTAALHLVLSALRQSDRDEVVLPTYSCISLYNAAIMARVRPLIVDVAEDSGNTSMELVRAVVTPDTRAVVIPHMFGCVAPVALLADLRIPIIEDCAHAIGAVADGRPAGALSKIAVFSFYATKMLPGVEGGAISCEDRNLADELRDLRDYTGQKPEWKLRYNYKLSDLHAAVTLAHFRKIPSYVRRRKELANRYNLLLAELPGVRLPNQSFYADHVYYRYVVRLVGDENVSKVRARMRTMGVGTGLGVLRAIHEELGFPDDSYPNASYWRRTALSLPIYPSLTEQEQDLVVQALFTALQEERRRTMSP